MPFCYEHPHPAVSVDIAVFTSPAGGRPEVLLIRRGREPFRGRWALPGGFVGIDEGLEQAARRELFEETGIKAAFLEQIGAFGQPGRDPRERVISIAYLARVPPGKIVVSEAGSDADEVRLFPLPELPELAFDHREILDAALQRLRGARSGSQNR